MMRPSFIPFALQTQLKNEYQSKISNVPNYFLEQQCDPWIFVVEWLTENCNIYGIGCNLPGNFFKMKINVEVGLFVTTPDPMLLQVIMKMKGLRVKIFNNITFRSNSFTCFDVLRDQSIVKPVTLAKIYTHSFEKAVYLHRELKKDTLSYRFAGVTRYYDINTFILLERYVRSENIVHPILYKWFNCDLATNDKRPDPVLPAISFDIETVSTDRDRVPLGDDQDDELYSVSIHHIHTKTLYTLVYVPLINLSNDEIKKRMLQLDEYESYYDITNSIEAFGSELELLKRTMALITIPHKLHFLYGYNSFGYDIKFLLTRCAYYGLNEYTKKFLWNRGYRYGCNQIHIDFYRVSRLLFNLQRYNLNTVAKHLLQESKTGVDAVALRFTFHKIRKEQRLYKHAELPLALFPSLRDTLQYNNQDTLLVSRLVEKSKCVRFVMEMSNTCGVSYTEYCAKFSEIQFRMFSECFVVGLKIGCFLTVFKDDVAIARVPYWNAAVQMQDMYEFSVDVSSHLSGINNTANTANNNTSNQSNLKKKKYPGGANYCMGEHSVDAVQTYDYRVAYAYLIAYENISDETAIVCPALIIAHLYDSIINPTLFKTYDYVTHTGSNASESKVLFYQYINEDLYCGGEFPFVKQELEMRQQNLIILIVRKELHEGVLSSIVHHFNEDRDNLKLQKKTYQTYIKMIQMKLDELTNTYDDNDFFIEEQNDSTANETLDTENNDAGSFAGSFNDDDNENNITTSQNADIDAISECGSFDGNDESANIGATATANHNDEWNSPNGDIMEKNATTKTDATVPTINDQIIHKGATTNKDVNVLIRKCAFENGAVKFYESGEWEMKKELQRNDMDALKEALRYAEDQITYYEDMYRLRKITVSSIYGCLGSVKTQIAALVTCIIRTILIKSANYVTKHYNCTVYYCDTDSIFLTNPQPDLNLAPILNELYPMADLSFKDKQWCLFIQKKVYYVMNGKELKYAQNKNGPSAWREMVNWFMLKTDIRTLDNIGEAFYEFYQHAYNVGKNDLHRFQLNVSIERDFLTNCPAAVFKQYLFDNYPSIATESKHNIFYYMKESNFIETIYRPFCELTQETMCNLNVFKFYDKIFKTVFNIIKARIKTNNAPLHVNISESNIRALAFRNFISVYDHLFAPKDQIQSIQLLIDKTES